MTPCILITVDCLRADHVGCYGYAQPTTPNIDNLAEEAVVFADAFSNGPYTTTSLPSILTSTILLRYSGEDIPLSRETVTLAEVLKENGIATAAFHSNPFLSPKFGYDRGFSYFEDFGAEPIGREERIRGLRGQMHGLMAKLNSKIQATLDTHCAHDGTMHRAFRLLSFYIVSLVGYSGARADGALITDKAISWLEGNPDGFAWLHYMDVHGPYVPPKKYRERFCHGKISRYKQAKVLCKCDTPRLISKEEVETLIDLYDAGICYVDSCIGDLVARLKEMGIYDDSLVVVTADHGEEFNEHGGFTHLCKLYDELLRVPLIVKMPGNRCHQEVDGLCSLIDLGPTILDVLKIPDSPSFEGASLLPMIRGVVTGRPWVLAACGSLDGENGRKQKMISLRTEDWKYIFREEGESELYNLQSDPGEKINLVKTDLTRAERLKTKLLEWSSRIRYESSPSLSADETLKGRLRALGYF